MLPTCDSVFVSYGLKHAVNPQISPLGLIYFLDFCMGAYSRGGFQIFLVVNQIPVEIVLLISCFFDPARKSNRMFFEGQANFRQLMAFFFASL